MALQSRSKLCWASRRNATKPWERSDDNTFWKPADSTHYPDTRVLQPGDLLLFEPIKPSVSQTLIQRFEQGTFTHAAVYLQSDRVICDANYDAKKVIMASLESYLKDYCLIGRRAPDIDAAGRSRIALMASTLLDQKYDAWPIFKAALERTVGIRNELKNPETLDKPFVCSTLCEHAIVAATGKSVHKRKGHYVLPEDLAATDILEDIPIDWKIVRD